MIDLHSHILPPLDDGAQDRNDACMMLQKAAESGVDILVATTHYSRHAEADYDRVFAEMQEVARQNGITLLPGMEYDYDRLTEIPPEKLRGLGGSRTILVDLKESYVSTSVVSLLFSLSLKGKSILLAHPERLWEKNYRNCLNAIPQAAVSLQLNSGSFLGRYGKESRHTAWRLLEEFPRCVIADDAHRSTGFRLAACREKLLTAFDEGSVNLWMEVNPHRILQDLPLLPWTPSGSRQQKLRRFWMKNF